MKLLMYTVYDTAVGAYLPPFYARAKGEALRNFSTTCNDREHQFFRHAPDYVLFELGEFDDATGLIEMLASGPLRVISALECLTGDDPRPVEPEHPLGRPVRSVM